MSGARNWRVYSKMFFGGAAVIIGGPAFTMWVMPTEEELFKRYNPDLQRKSLENRQQTQEEFDQYVNKLKEYSKSNKPIWDVWEDDIKQRKDAERLEHVRRAEELKLQQEEMRREAGIPSK